MDTWHFAVVLAFAVPGKAVGQSSGSPNKGGTTLKELRSDDMELQGADIGATEIDKPPLAEHGADIQNEIEKLGMHPEKKSAKKKRTVKRNPNGDVLN